jgi:DNA modification methylase
MARDSPRKLWIERLPPAALKPDPLNPRRHSTRQIEQIARSIKRFGFNAPALIDRDNRIVAGHGRVLAAQRAGLDEVPVIRLDHLTDAQARAFAIADNRLAEIATWDDQLLGEVFRDLASLNLDFSLEITGFSIAEIDLRIEGVSTSGSDKPDPADQLPEPAYQTPVSQSGDLWHLDDHRVLCGDALDRASYPPLMRSALAHLVFTDPPFNLRINGHLSGNGALQHREFAMGSGEMTDGQFIHFLTCVQHLLVRHSVPGSIHYICMDWRHLLALLTAGQQAYTTLKNLCVWVKSNAGMGSFYRSQHELIAVYKNGTAAHRNNIELGRHGRNRSNVWSYPGANSFGRHGEEGNLLAIHPTVKPVALIADAILDCSARGDIILDPFLGSGSTLIAAHRVGRRCYGMEIDPLYVDTVIRRWQRFSGGTARHAETGEKFDDVAGRMEAPHG